MRETGRDAKNMERARIIMLMEALMLDITMMVYHLITDNLGGRMAATILDSS
jgi:hypothetical protein